MQPGLITGDRAASRQADSRKEKNWRRTSNLMKRLSVADGAAEHDESIVSPHDRIPGVQANKRTFVGQTYQH